MAEAGARPWKQRLLERAGRWWQSSWPLVGVIAGLVGFGIMSLPDTRNPIFKFQMGFFDYLRRIQPNEALDGPDDPVVIIGYDEATAQIHGQIPDRAALDSALRFVLSGNPTALVVDYQFTSPDRVSSSVNQALHEVDEHLPESKAIETALDDIRRRFDVTGRLLETLQDARVIGTFYAFGKNEKGVEAAPAPPIAPDSILDSPRPPAQHHCANFRAATAINLDRPEFLAAYPHYGNAREEPDWDGVIRRYPLFVRLGDRLYPSLGLAAATLHSGMGFPAQVECDATGTVVHGFSVGADEPIILKGRYSDALVWAHFRGSFQETFPNWIPFHRLLSTDERPPAERFAGKMVFVGPRSDYEDKYPTFADVVFPGVAVHATVAHSLVTKEWLHRPQVLDHWIEPLACLALGVLVTLLFWRVESSYLLVLAPGFLFGGFFVSWALLQRGWLVDSFFPGFTGAVAVLLCGGLRFVIEQRTAVRERRRAEQEQRRAEQEELRAERLGAFLSPEVAKIAGENPDLLLPKRHEISVLFSDIRSFTTTAEGMTPELLAEMLSEYLTWMTEVVLTNHGTLDKYIGDAVMALFGAPAPDERHARWACTTALEMMEALDGLNERWREQGRNELHIGIGINTGEVVVGTMGSKKKPEYTCIGDEVNFASRAEGLTKAYGSTIIVGERTKTLAGDEFLFRDLGPVRVKGKTRGVRIFELVGVRHGDASWVDTFHQGLNAFLLRDWDKAEELFERVIKARGGQDGPSKAFLVWTKSFRAHPPDEAWDGTLERAEK